MSQMYELTVTNLDGSEATNYYGSEVIESILKFVHVADQQNSIVAVTIELNDKTLAVFTPIGRPQ